MRGGVRLFDCQDSLCFITNIIRRVLRQKGSQMTQTQAQEAFCAMEDTPRERVTAADQAAAVVQLSRIALHMMMARDCRRMLRRRHFGVSRYSQA